MEHVFEKSGLGKAPFRCVAVASIPSASLAASNPEAYRNALRELPRDVGCGTCNYCGIGIMHNFIIVSSDGRRFVVGSDCVAKTGDAGLIKEVRGERLKIAREKRAAVRSVKAEARQAVWKRERDERAEAFKVEHAALIEAAKPFESIAFVKDVIGRGVAGGWVSEKAIAAVKSCIEEQTKLAQLRRVSEHVGKVGERRTFKGTVERVASFTRQSFNGYGDERVYIVTLRDEEGHAIVSKSASFSAQRGEVLTIKATIKEHAEYEGEKQTVVQRVKALEVAADWSLTSS